MTDVSKQRKSVSISKTQVQAMLEKHTLGQLRSFDPIYGNTVNTNFEIETVSSEQYILKIQHHPGGHAIETDYRVCRLLKDRLPISPLQILDTECNVIPHPCLVSS
jgi:hypothetical protein